MTQTKTKSWNMYIVSPLIETLRNHIGNWEQCQGLPGQGRDCEIPCTSLDFPTQKRE
jgi:hypothetical protein